MNVMEILQKQFQDSAEKLQSVQKDYSKTLSDRQTLDSQLNENRQVKEELDLATEESKIYKLIGPALVTQDLVEAKSNVEKRISYISGELKRKDDQLKDMDKKQDEAREKMQEIQTQLQKLQQAPN
ncbi:prefoldin subunit 6 [Eurytemora carolleeae]|uniref:prefoldin subunit 6 n=1 Tax=Eurytemora carolleeae TaxID=1294199 RepID=UPI000C78F36C|nr:prefoldin subunit 6 [Eurytemora carolleeae]|eukprot:XP_023325228.1 prefoldin subunit 6-like [Eurytemora affinis]